MSRSILVDLCQACLKKDCNGHTRKVTEYQYVLRHRVKDFNGSFINSQTCSNKVPLVFESGLRRFEGSFKCNFKCFNDTLRPFQGPFKRKFKVVSIVFQEYFKGEKKVPKEL